MDGFAIFGSFFRSSSSAAPPPPRRRGRPAAGGGGRWQPHAVHARRTITCNHAAAVVVMSMAVDLRKETTREGDRDVQRDVEGRAVACLAAEPPEWNWQHFIRRTGARGVSCRAPGFRAAGSQIVKTNDPEPGRRASLAQKQPILVVKPKYKAN